VIDTAIVLAAGEGSRLRGAAPLKPLCEVASEPLVKHCLTGLALAGVQRAIVVLGYGADVIREYLTAVEWPLLVESVITPDYRLPNGTSVLAAERAVAGKPALLVMCDHLVEPGLYARVKEAGAGEGLALGVDRRVDQEDIDMDDVTRVRTNWPDIVAIGKGLADYDCFDTGVFAISSPFFAALHTQQSPSVSNGVQLLANQGLARAVDCGDLVWIDVDEPSSLARAAGHAASRTPR
jgi:1L-myo-inositol 1-phosphate cytidylyltransferase